MKNEQIKVHVEKDMKNWLKDKAADRRCSMSQVVVGLILEAMRKSK